MALTGQIAVASAGTAEQGSDVPGGIFALRAHPDNAGVVYVGNDEGSSPDVTSANGFALAATDGPIIWDIVNLDRLWFDAAESGDIICWALISSRR